MSGLFKAVGSLVSGVVGGFVPDVQDAGPAPSAPTPQSVEQQTTAANYEPTAPATPSDQEIQRAQQRAAVAARSSSGRRSTILTQANNGTRGQSTRLGG